MRSIKEILKEIRHNPWALPYGLARNVPWLVPDPLFVRLMYRSELGRWPDLRNPKRFTEKLQWLKLNDHNPQYTTLVDKLTVKDYIAKQFGNGYVFKTLGVWNRADDIDFKALPARFVLKCNHFGGGVVFICKDKSDFDERAVMRELSDQLRRGIYWTSREWPYKNVVPKIFAEEYMEDEYGELRDYKFHCLNGEPRMLVIMSNRYSKDGKHNFNAFDMDFNPLKTHFGGDGYFPSDEDFKCPVCFEEMKILARKLSAGIPFVRVDFYCIRGKIYFGELTFYPTSGLDNQSSDEWDLEFGSYLDLKLVK